MQVFIEFLSKILIISLASGGSAHWTPQMNISKSFGSFASIFMKNTIKLENLLKCHTFYHNFVLFIDFLIKIDNLLDSFSNTLIHFKILNFVTTLAATVPRTACRLQVIAFKWPRLPLTPKNPGGATGISVTWAYFENKFSQD